jgi:hypothetical protein
LKDGEKETGEQQARVDWYQTRRRYVRRGAAGKFKESDQVSRALASDRRKKAKRKAKRGHGDRGDR